jgi:phosphatidylserine decarboxylase
VTDRAAGVPFAKEGFPFIGAAAGITLIAWWLGWIPVAVVGAMLTLFVSWFFRNPLRRVPQGPGLVVAPGDGVVLAVEEEFEPRYLKDRAVRISIFLNVFDVHINRMPCEGIVENVQYQPGLFLVASKPHATVKKDGGRGQSALRAGCGTHCQTHRVLGKPQGPGGSGRALWSHPVRLSDGYVSSGRDGNQDCCR